MKEIITTLLKCLHSPNISQSYTSYQDVQMEIPKKVCHQMSRLEFLEIPSRRALLLRSHLLISADFSSFLLQSRGMRKTEGAILAYNNKKNKR